MKRMLIAVIWLGVLSTLLPAQSNYKETYQRPFLRGEYPVKVPVLFRPYPVYQGDKGFVVYFPVEIRHDYLQFLRYNSEYQAEAEIEILVSYSDGSKAADRIWKVLDTRPALEIVETPHQENLLSGRVTFDQVSFHYDGEQDSDHERLNESGRTTRYGGGDVLNDVSFAVEPGQQVALLGATGSGKSTLIQLIPRFYDALNGRVLIDGVDVRDWQPEALRKRIGVVLQESILFSGTIFENIAYGRPEASFDEVVTAAKAAQAHEFITAMPDGYDSIVEERGTNLSGGQKQRIAIARALLISPSILIMDDSTSAVDMDTEASIQTALDSLMANRTTFIVAQRISSVLHADQILVLEHGRIAAQGTHAQLLQESPIYQEIYQSQLGDGQADDTL